MRLLPKTTLGAAFISLCLWVPTAFAVPMATATLNGGSFIQTGSVLNDAGSGANITSVIYDLGTAGDGIATWDGGTNGGVASNFLSDPRWFQTVTWGGLNIAPGAAFNFAGLDIDAIVTLVPLNVTGAIPGDGGAAALANASMTVMWSNNTTSTVSLVQQPWNQTQTLRFGASSVPEPGTLALLGLGLAGLGFRRSNGCA